MRRWAGALLFALLVAGCTSVRSRPGRPYVFSPAPAKGVVASARSQIGVSYHYGGASPQAGFDCSGLVWWAYKENGGAIPHSTKQQYELGQRVKSTELRQGDLVFFKTAGAPPSHVGIMVDHKSFVHAPSTGEKVRIDSLLNRYWSKHFYGARRME
jgi:cell wall-associated NlpC family hydrolase